MPRKKTLSEVQMLRVYVYERIRYLKVCFGVAKLRRFNTQNS